MPSGTLSHRALSHLAGISSPRSSHDFLHIYVMLSGMNILCLECSHASDFVAHYRQAGWGLGATFGLMIVSLLNGLLLRLPEAH